MEFQTSLGKTSLFKDVNAEALQRLAAQVKLKSFPAGTIVKENDPSGDGLYIIKSGMARVTKRAEPGMAKGAKRMEGSGAEAVLALLRAGDTFGELSLIDGQPHSATVSALQPIEVYYLERDAFWDVLKINPEIAVAMLPTLANMVRFANRWVAASI
jgi:CRP/FNR family transcriptional regulator/CRP/FNR family cyclic AMP-dependent transcriptional regulator